MSNLEADVVIEIWVDWVQRVIAETTQAMHKAGVPDWAEEQRRRKWSWCGHVCRKEDERWEWKNVEWIISRGTRAGGHLVTRWIDDIDFACV